MCMGPSAAEKEAAAAARVEAEANKRKALENIANKKREDIASVIGSQSSGAGFSAGAGRRSLFKTSGGGFLGRFN